MEINRGSTFAKVLARQRALEARDRKDAAIEKGRLADHYAYPGSKEFQQAVQVIAQYLADLAEAKVSSIRDAYSQTDTPLSGETVEDAMHSIRESIETVIAARMGSWGGAVTLVQQRTGKSMAGASAALGEAQRELRGQAAKICERAEANLDVLLQSGLATFEKRQFVPQPLPSKLSRTAAVLRVLIASPSDVKKERDVLTSVIMEWNAMHSMAEGIVLIPVRWETNAYPASGDYPQALINKQIVDDCDILMGVFWSKLGTPTPVAPSGTAEEIERLRSRDKNILLYFSTAPLPESSDAEQWEKLKKYQESLRKDSLYWEFSSLDELFRAASRHLASVVHNITAELGEVNRAEQTSTVRTSAEKLPASRPIIVPKRYGKGVLKEDMGYTGLGVVNDAEPAYDITVSNIEIKDGTRLEFHRGQTERLTKDDGEAFYPAFIQMRLSGTFGNGLFDLMRERGVMKITVPIRYRDSNDNWYQTDATLERDVHKPRGLRLGWKQKQIPEPPVEAD